MTSKNKITLLHQPCPKCPSSDAYCEYGDGHGYCYSCEYYKPPNEDALEYTYEYVPHRGLNKRTLEHYDIKSKIDADGKPIADGFYYPSGCCKSRILSSKDFYWLKPEGLTEVPADLFGRDKFTAGGNEAIIITEGEYDAATCFQVLGIPAVSVRSASSAASDCALSRSFLGSFQKIYLGFDADGRGRAATAAVARLFDYNKILVLQWDRRKDANEYLLANEADEIRNIYANAKKYIPETVVAVNSSSIRKILAERPSVGVPYPFPTLNEKLFGIRTKESVLITAPSGVGKTEFMHAIEYQLLRETNDRVASIFIEEPKADHFRALASIHLGKPAFVPEHGVSESAVVEAVEDAVVVDDRLFLYSHFGSDDPDVILDTIRLLVTTFSVRYVLLDHISLVVSGLRNERDERRALDYICTRLEMMLKDLDFGLIFVSHINDLGQTRGSRAIEQLADVRIELSRNVKEGSDIVSFLVSKNRPPMTKAGPAGSYRFDMFKRKYTLAEGGEDGGLTIPSHPWRDDTNMVAFH